MAIISYFYSKTFRILNFLLANLIAEYFYIAVLILLLSFLKHVSTFSTTGPTFYYYYKVMKLIHEVTKNAYVERWNSFVIFYPLHVFTSYLHRWSTAGVGDFDDGEGHKIFTFTPKGHYAYRVKNI